MCEFTTTQSKTWSCRVMRVSTGLVLFCDRSCQIAQIDQSHSHLVHCSRLRRTAVSWTKKDLALHSELRNFTSTSSVDNGTCFSSSEFTCLNGIIHKFVSPNHQALNGLSERSVSFIKSGLNKIHGGSLQNRRSRLLYAHRITPHPTTGVTPAELLMKRSLCTRLDSPSTDMESVVFQNRWKERLHHDKHAVQRSINIRDPVFVKNFGRGKDWLHHKTVVPQDQPRGQSSRLEAP